MGDSYAWTLQKMHRSRQPQPQSKARSQKITLLWCRITLPLVLEPHSVNKQLVDHRKEARHKMPVGPLPQEADTRERMKPANTEYRKKGRSEKLEKKWVQQYIVTSWDLQTQNTCMQSRTRKDSILLSQDFQARDTRECREDQLLSNT
jgi:hypothetical protein